MGCLLLGGCACFGAGLPDFWRLMTRLIARSDAEVFVVLCFFPMAIVIYTLYWYDVYDVTKVKKHASEY